jgi:murein DD-endopeptidase MepM/ murein hydrolase activator NlpD
MLKIISSFLVFLALVSCTNLEAARTPVVVVNPKIIPTNTFFSPTALPSITPTQEIPCDPFSVDFCITEGHFVLQRPIYSPANELIDSTYPYGSTANGTRDPHHGVEFSNASGTPVHAVADGTVIFAGSDTEAIYSPWQNYYGNLVVIEHQDKLFTLYAHLSRIDVEVGQNVFAGDKIGEVGRTGVAIGSHLHFEVRRGNSEDYFATQNPELWFVPAKDANADPFGTLVISIVNQNQALIPYAEFTIRYHPEKSGPPAKSYYGTTYAPDMLNGDTRSTPRSGSVDENAVLGELPPGHYRIAVNANSKMYERWVEVESGKLTQVVFIVK